MGMIKKRLTNPIFYVNTLVGIAAVIGGYFELTGVELTTWQALFDTIQNAVSNPYVVFMVVAYIYTTVIDTSSNTLSDTNKMTEGK